MDRETIVELSDTESGYVKIETNKDTFIVPLHIGIKVSKWLERNSEYANPKTILIYARKWRMNVTGE